MRLRSRPLVGAAVLATALFHIQSSDARAEVFPAPNEASWVNVWDNNVENLMTNTPACPGDWQDIVWYMKTRLSPPFLFIVQQVNRGEGTNEQGIVVDDTRNVLKLLTDKMNRLLIDSQNEPVLDEYRWVIANPAPSEYPGAKCDKKLYQTNAIIYRSARFEPQGTEPSDPASSPDVDQTCQARSDDCTTWYSWFYASGMCVQAAQPTELRRRDRSQGVAVRFFDNVTGEYISIASAHWPWQTDGMNGERCATENLSTTRHAVNNVGPPAGSAGASSLGIIAGDMNMRAVKKENGPWMAWYRNINYQLSPSSYGDPVYEICSGNRKMKCTDQHNWTNDSGRRRIDMIFAKRSGADPSFGSTETIDFDEADAADPGRDVGAADTGDYSNHRAVRTSVRY